jgi:undecaprenyl-diphosphatase
MLNRLLAFDHALSARLAIRQAGFVRVVMQVLAHSGDGIVWLAAGAGPLLMGWPDLALLEEITVISLMVIVALFKTLFRRRRPTGERGTLYFQLDAHSFPSGHAARAAALAVTLGSISTGVVIGMAIWAASVSLSRVMLGVHYLSDVVAGAAIGIVWGMIILSLLAPAV